MESLHFDLQKTTRRIITVISGKAKNYFFLILLEFSVKIVKIPRFFVGER